MNKKWMILMSSEVGIGIIGCGRIGKVHAHILSKLPNVKLVAVADILEESARALAKMYGMDFYTDYKMLLKRKDIDAVFICTPSHLHAQPTIDAAKAGKHVFCEKPFATTLEDADAMLKTVKKAGIKLCLGYMMRFTPPFMQVKKMMGDEVIGDVYFVNAEINCWPMSKWMYEPDKGVIVECHVHAIDLIRWFVGEAKTVYVKGNALISDWAKEYGTLDSATVILGLKNGAVVDLFGTASSGKLGGPSYGNVIVNIYGTKGTISANLEKQPLTVFLKEAYSEELKEGYNYPDVVYSHGRIELAKHFIDCILEDKEPIVTGEDGRAVTEILLAAKESARTDKVVKIPLAQ